MEAITYKSDDESMNNRIRDSNNEDINFSALSDSDLKGEEYNHQHQESTTSNYSAESLETNDNDSRASVEKNKETNEIGIVVNDKDENQCFDSKKIKEEETHISRETLQKSPQINIVECFENKDKAINDIIDEGKYCPIEENDRENNEGVGAHLLQSDVNDDEGSEDTEDDEDKVAFGETSSRNSFNGNQIITENGERNSDVIKDELSDVEINEDHIGDAHSKNNRNVGNESNIGRDEKVDININNEELKHDINKNRDLKLNNHTDDYKVTGKDKLKTGNDVKDDETQDDSFSKYHNEDESNTSCEFSTETNRSKQEAIIDAGLKYDGFKADTTTSSILTDEDEADDELPSDAESANLMNGRGSSSKDLEIHNNVYDNCVGYISSNKDSEDNGSLTNDSSLNTKEERREKITSKSPSHSQHHNDDLRNYFSSEETEMKASNCEFWKKEFFNETSPKINGTRYAMAELSQENNFELEGGQDNKHPYDSDRTNEFGISQVNNNEESFNYLSGSVNKSFVSTTIRHTESDDDVTRFSTSSSTSLTSSTSSSHQLVIDHQIEDGSDPTVSSNTDRRMSKCVKVNLKRKLSDVSLSHSPNSSPQHKMPHLELTPCGDDDNREEESEEANTANDTRFEEDNLNKVPSEILENSHTDKPNGNNKIFIPPENSEEVKSVPSTETLGCSAIIAKNENTEGTPEASPVNLFPEVNSSPLLNSLLLRKLPEFAEKAETSRAVGNRTRFFCFNCKTDSFETLQGLNEHQSICLANKSLLPSTALINPVNAVTHAPAPLEKPLEKPDNTNTALSDHTGLLSGENELSKKCYYKCSSCGTFHENWNLFLHIREMHKRFMCLYCLRMFPSAEKLSLHLEIKHDLEQDHYNSEEALRADMRGSLDQGSISKMCLLMCCTCEHIFWESDSFTDHVCTEFMQACPQCGQKGRHTNQCKEQNEVKRFRSKKKGKTKGLTIPQSKISPILETNNIIETAQFRAPLNTHRSFGNNLIHQFNNQHHHHQQQQQHQTLDLNNTNPLTALADGNYKNDNPSCSPTKILNARECLIPQINVPYPKLQTVEGEVKDLISIKQEHLPQKSPLIVPKFKLRVPKEFQKSVDAAISSSETDDDEDNPPLNEETAEAKPVTTTTTSTTDTSFPEATKESTLGSLTERHCSQETLRKTTTNDDEDSLDETNSNLVRILQEIERTKQDIKRTKETLHASTSKSAGVDIEKSTTKSELGGKIDQQNWSPTPPASPNSQTEIGGSEHKKILGDTDQSLIAPTADADSKQQSSTPLQPPSTVSCIPSMKQDRCNTTDGSDVDMDIDETITGQPTQCIKRSNNLDYQMKETESVDQTNQNAKPKEVSNGGGNSTDPEFQISNSVLDKDAATEERAEDNNPKEMTGENNISDPETAIRENCSTATEQRLEQQELTGNHDDGEVPAEPSKQARSPPADGIIVADEEMSITDLQLDRPLEKFEMVEFVRICLKAVYPLCLYCNHARRIAVNGRSLVLHLIAEHRFAATVDSITAEELKPNTIVAKLKSFLPALEDHYLNSTSYCTLGDGAFTHHFNERIYECFQCRFVTTTHKELYLHNRKMHLRTAILCFMCRSNFFSFSEILCHICPGEAHKISVFDVKFRCCLCELDNIPSPFRLMVHLRKKHFACDVCLEDCQDQGRLSSHVWKHKLHHLCYRCGIAYRNKMDITKHLFWKHGTESIICKRCLQKRWRHVYHFCIPPSNFICEICNLCFSRATYLNVHKRAHSGDLRYPCTDENCDQKFISRRLLLKHTTEHQLPDAVADPPKSCDDANVKKELTEALEDAAPTDQQNEAVESGANDSNKSPNAATEPELTTDKTETNATQILSPEEEDSTKLKAETPSVRTCGKQRKKKKKKRSKESLEDLNLIAPNLSESDSSGDSEAEGDSKSKTDDDSLVPRVMLSPPSETEQDKEEEKNPIKNKASNDNNVLDIWKKILESQGSDSTAVTPEQKTEESTDYTEENYPTPQKLHVAQSDHDYCSMTQPEQPKPLIDTASPTKASLTKRKTSKSPRRTVAAHRSGVSSASSTGSSGSDSDSSCSCGSNCSCSSSNSDSSSNSCSSNDTDSSSASRRSRKRHRKKSERDRGHKKSASSSPQKKHRREENTKNHKTAVANISAVLDAEETNLQPRSPTPPKEPLFNESDLETAESETDEEFYDEHPQKFANELLAQKRAQLMAQTLLSPSHNYDIVENSRPSTPSLPEEVAREKKVRLKKKKRDRKSANRSTVNASDASLLKLDADKATGSNAVLAVLPNENLQLQVPSSKVDSLAEYHLPLIPSPLIANSLGAQYHEKQQLNAVPHPSHVQLTPRAVGPNGAGRMSEGSSCSDADGSLKRSKRARRPNKFYGYTSDDEQSLSGLGQPLMIGMRAIKPQPPPQLTWRKEDLPTPSKSVLNNHKHKTPRTSRTSNSSNTLSDQLVAKHMPPEFMKSKKKRIASSDRKQNRKRNSKFGSNLPRIPTLKIRPSQIGFAPTHKSFGKNGSIVNIPSMSLFSSEKSHDVDVNDDDEDPESSEISSDDDESQQMLVNSTMMANASGTAKTWEEALQQTLASTAQSSQFSSTQLVLPSVAAQPPPPQPTVFNQIIPPALLPNPDFATLQYFKANNIRYPIRPPNGARQARDGESVYCYCRCPYDEVSEMIACDGENCLIEWFHFECVGIMVAPQGKWFCAECRPKYSEELYPTNTA